MRFGLFNNNNNEIIDEITAVFMPEGKSYTGLEQVEIFCHGGQQVVTKILNELLSSGARAAEPGEFTQLAFLSGKIDLLKAEAVAEIIAANTEHSFETAREHLLGSYSNEIEKIRDSIISIIAEVEASIDYPEEEIDPSDRRGLLDTISKLVDDIEALEETYQGGKIINEGYKIAIAGRPNAGKSSLFNQLLKKERALVTSTAGTTRDYLSEWIDLEGFAVNIIDTAGIRKGGGKIEKAGQKSAKKIIDSSNMVLWIYDLSRKSWKNELETDMKTMQHSNITFIGNKNDLVEANDVKEYNNYESIAVSCVTGSGIKKLKKEIIKNIENKMPDFTSGLIVTSARHQQKLKIANGCLQNAKELITISESPEITAVELRSAASAIDEITGKVYTEEILGKIFSKFCVGK